MTHIKRPAVAGLFYPADSTELQTQVTTFLEQATAHSNAPPKAIIAPHAGYIYSGPIAGSAYAQLLEQRSTIQRVVLLAPAHRVAFNGIARSSAIAFETPLGEIPVDTGQLERIRELTVLNDLAFEEEHSIEVQLPFLQEALEAFSLVPLLVGQAEAEAVAVVLEQLWGGTETLIVISSDLSHYLDYTTAKQVDAATSQAIERLAPERLNHESACGRIPVGGLLIAARNHQLQSQVLDLRNSGDTAGDKSRVVGYGAYVFY